MAKKMGLGKGLDILIPQIKETPQKESQPVSTAQETVSESPKKVTEAVVEARPTQSAEIRTEVPKTMMKVSEIEPCRNQPRKFFNEDSLEELADSIRQHGVIQPLIVQKRNDYYEIIAGERRWRAAKMAGVSEVPVILKEYSDSEKLEISLIENIQREALNPIEEAKAYKRLMEEFELKQDEIAEKVSKNRTTITNTLRLLKLNDRVQQMVLDEMITSGHARALLSLDDPQLQEIIANQIFDEKLSVRETEKLIKKELKKLEESQKEENEPTKKQPEDRFIYDEIEERIKTILGTKVKVSHNTNHKGKIQIEYYSETELERILDLIQTIQK